jgi:hypothetical protein
MQPNVHNELETLSNKYIKLISIYKANTFTLNLPEDWEDKTVYILTGPVTGGVQHNVIINVEQNVSFDNVEDYAEWQIGALEGELKGCRLLKKGKKTLENGLPAYEAVFRWYPTDELRIYQQQIYVLVQNTGYKLTASFTKKTRKTLGPMVEQMMLSFNPVQKKTPM